MLNKVVAQGHYTICGLYVFFNTTLTNHHNISVCVGAPALSSVSRRMNHHDLHGDCVVTSLATLTLSYAFYGGGDAHDFYAVHVIEIVCDGRV